MAFARHSRASLKTPSRSSRRHTSMTLSSTPSDRAEASKPGRWNVPLEGCQRAAIREALGTASLSRASRFTFSYDAKILTPVMLPPGRARLATCPSPTMSSDTATMGMFVVAWRRARMDRSPPVARASGLSLTSSAA